jgi:hypothetical protein
MFCRLPLNAARPTASLDTTDVRPRQLRCVPRRCIRPCGGDGACECTAAPRHGLPSQLIPVLGNRRHGVGATLVSRSPPTGPSRPTGTGRPARLGGAAPRAVRRQPGMPRPGLGTVVCRVIMASSCTPAARCPVRESPAKRGPCWDRGWALLAAGRPIEKPPTRQLRRTLGLPSSCTGEGDNPGPAPRVAPERLGRSLW